MPPPIVNEQSQRTLPSILHIEPGTLLLIIDLFLPLVSGVIQGVLRF